MTAPNVILPAAPIVDLATGRLAGATRHYEKRFKELAGLYSDEVAFDGLAATLGEQVVYEVWEHRASDEPGDLVFGSSVMKPGRVGEEYFVTRGHQHLIADRSEIYHCVRGAGVMLMEHPNGEVKALAMSPGVIVYVPPHWIHRSVNIGDDTLITIFSYAADAGQNYGIIERSCGMRARVVRDRRESWVLADNPAWRPHRCE
jgi:glucose-6-phosphate isomerase, archaeal